MHETRMGHADVLANLTPEVWQGFSHHRILKLKTNTGRIAYNMRHLDHKLLLV